MIPKKVYISVVVWDEGRKYDFLEVRERPYQTTDTQCHWREYTDLSSLWHDASEEPVGNNWKILCQDEMNGCWVENRVNAMLLHKNWNVYTEIEMLVRWAYISDLLPKGGK